MARLDEWRSQILEAQVEWDEIPPSLDKESLSNLVHKRLMSIPDAKRYLDAVVARKEKSESKRKTLQLASIRQYMRRLADREDTLRLEQDLKLAAKKAREIRYQEKLAARLARNGMTPAQLKMPVKSAIELPQAILSTLSNDRKVVLPNSSGNARPVGDVLAQIKYERDHG